LKTKIGFVHKFAYSFFDFAAYKEFLAQGLGKSILYIFLVTLIFSTIGNINVINTFNAEISNVQAKFVQSSPKFELKDGLFSIDSDNPIYYKYHGSFSANLIFTNIIMIDTLKALISDVPNLHDKPVASESNSVFSSAASSEPSYYMLIVDTSGKTSSSALDTYSDGIYINSTGLVLKQNYQTIHTISFADYNKLVLTNEVVQNELSNFKIRFSKMILILGPLISFLLNLISGFLIVAPLSLNIGSIIGVKLKYKKACILSFYAMTLPLLLQALLNIAGITSNEFIIIFYIITLIYCGLAMNEIKKTDKSNLNYM